MAFGEFAILHPKHVLFTVLQNIRQSVTISEGGERFHHLFTVAHLFIFLKMLQLFVSLRSASLFLFHLK